MWFSLVSYTEGEPQWLSLLSTCIATPIIRF
jgi:hypothetical protein